jgi:PhoPQ-activated pathogenicity-related protein
MRGRAWRWGLTAALISLAVAGTGRANLSGYVARPEGDYRWEKVTETAEGGVTISELRLHAQTWHGIPWHHTIRLYRPAMARSPRTALLLITGGDPGREANPLGVLMATRLGAPIAILFQIPNQPLFDGKTEDELIAHTFEEYLKSGDETWPLLLPMVKSAVKAMDAVQAYSEQAWGTKIEGFVVAGASKRGWTTYLTGAVDPRVRGIIPMVFDNLQFEAQMVHQRQIWGEYSEQIAPFTRRGLQEQLASERGKRLARLVDPWYYRDRLTMPKLIVLGANDRYWATDALTYYWGGLPDEKWVLTVPNSGHKLEDRGRVVATVAAFFQHVAAKQPLPRLTFRSKVVRGEARLRVAASTRPKEVRLWTARSASLDFRGARWESSPMRADGNAYIAEVPIPASGGIAWFGEAEFDGEGASYTLSTPAHIAPDPGRLPTPSPGPQEGGGS